MLSGLNPIKTVIQYLSLVLIFLVILSGCVSKNNEIATIEVRNTASVDIPDAIIRIADTGILDKINSTSGTSINVRSDTIHPMQLIREKDTIIELLFLCELKANEGKFFTISKTDQQVNFKRRTQAEISIKKGGEWQGRLYQGGLFENIEFLRVPDEHTDHSSYIRYEGPGWESDLVGYRFYLDWRNAIDIFGKKVDTMVLQNVGQDEFDSYHEMSDWGVDILNVGESLGMGSIGYWHENKAERVAVTDSIFCEISYSGILESKIKTTYFGWQISDYRTDLISRLSIQAGSRLTMHQLEISSEMDNLCTGIVKHPDAELIQPESPTGEWIWFASWGRQTLQDDLSGMAVIYRQDDLIKLAEDELNHVVVLNPSDNTLTYYFLAAWELEPGGIRSKEEFVAYLNEQAEILNHEPIVK
ncbi:MAG: hypothetical protein AMS27_02755 [Bacteroides sp. SM23_62_1]|nr:MAG: hypothetical protein AMS27_02755 [Bacteroides sp. SM23_62_1]